VLEQRLLRAGVFAVSHRWWWSVRPRARFGGGCLAVGGGRACRATGFIVRHLGRAGRARRGLVPAPRYIAVGTGRDPGPTPPVHSPKFAPGRHDPGALRGGPATAKRADRLQRIGVTLVDEDAVPAARYPLVLVLPPRQREEARALLARACMAVAR
jgi:hypothetical protein